MNENTKYLIALSHFPKFGPKSIARLEKQFPQLKETFFAPLKNFQKTGLSEKILLDFFHFRKTFDIETTLRKIKQEGIKILTRNDENYPSLLKEISSPPVLLYYKGTFDSKDDFPFSIVGTRKNTPQGEIATNTIASELSDSGITIISGLATGVDTFAHQAAVNNKKRTIAVLGTGVDEESIYPRHNKDLSRKIVENNGAIVSEFIMGSPALRHHFPQRNRIIAGMSLGVLVVEAAKKSGSLITANYSLEQNREVMAVPGNILNSVSFGPNQLIKQGAVPVTETNDVLEALNLTDIKTFKKTIAILPQTEEEKIIYKHITHEAIHINDIIRLTKMTASVINSTLTIMEMKGMIKNIGNMSYILNN